MFTLIKEHPETVLARPISDIVQNIDRFLVAQTDDGLMLGAISWQILPEIGAPKQPSVEIKSLCVKPGAQRRGIGRRLVKGALRRIRPLQPVQAIVLTFSPEFFAQFGFQKVPKEKLMHKIYAGCINCTRYDSPFTCPETAMTLDLLSADREGSQE